jgi:aminoglycoside phosphotransferase (APT) family kinase protein
VERELTAVELAAYLQETGRAPADVEVLKLERLPGGFSKGTYLVELQMGPTQVESWVLRRDLSFTPLQTCVIDEFPLLSALHARGLPVPTPLWSEADASRLGAPVIAVRRVAGSGDMNQWAKNADDAKRIALSAARLLAQIHAVDLASLPSLQVNAPGSSGATPLAVVAHVEAFWQTYRTEPDPLVELVFDWLRRHAPTPGLRTLVHGDYGLHNLLVADGQVNAVLDWEFAHAGDPREDLAYARPFVEKVLPWSEFTGAYEAAGGASSDDAALHFYSVLGTFRNALGCMKVLHALRHGDAGIDSKFVYVGRSYAQQLLRSAAQMTGVLAAA